MKSIAISLVFGAVLLPTIAFAKPVYLHMLTTQFPKSRLSHACQTCHEVGKAMGPYGRDFVRIKNELGMGQMSAVWAALHKLDSDGDGKTNGAELAKDGDPNDRDE